MKIVHEEVVIDAGSFSKSKEYAQIHQQISEAIKVTDWPHGSGIFTIKPGLHVNGVDPIKKPFIIYLVSKGWRVEIPLELKKEELRPGDLDAVIQILGSFFAAEWETGNISSSHRAVNKLVLGLIRGAIIGGALILPSRALYVNLTDRIGNYDELAPYFPLWKAAVLATHLIH